MQEPKRPATVLLVEDLPAEGDLLRRTLEQEGFGVSAVGTGEHALEAVRALDPDVILLDAVPGSGGFDVCRRLKQATGTRRIPVIVVTGVRERSTRVEGIEAGADDFLAKPIDADELKARVKSLVRLKRYTHELDSAEAVIVSLGLTVEARDPHTKGHCERLANYATSLGHRLGLDDEDIAALYRGAFLHDVGKIGIPEAILLKPGALSPDEYAVIKRHPLIGEALCGNMRALQKVRPIIRHHHERLDGSGYPDGLRGDAIPLAVQIMTVADVYDALTTDRPYRPAGSSEAAYAELLEGTRRGWYQRDLVSEFIAMDTGV